MLLHTWSVLIAYSLITQRSCRFTIHVYIYIYFHYTRIYYNMVDIVTVGVFIGCMNSLSQHLRQQAMDSLSWNVLCMLPPRNT